MNYLSLRDKIENGDVVFLEPGNSLGKLIPVFTGGSVSHCGIAVWLKDSRGVDRLMLLEGKGGGCRLVTLSSYAHRNMVVARVGLYWGLVEDYALSKVGVVQYGYTDLFWIWLREVLVRNGAACIAAVVPDAPGEVCSQVVADILRRGGFDMVTLISPNRLLKEMKRLYQATVLK